MKLDTEGEMTIQNGLSARRPRSTDGFVFIRNSAEVWDNFDSMIQLTKEEFGSLQKSNRCGRMVMGHMSTTTALGSGGIILFLIFGSAIGKYSGSDGANNRLVWAERMNDDSGQSVAFMAVGKGNRVFQIVSDTSPCANVLNYVSSDHVFIGILFDKGFESVSCVGEHDGKVEVLQRDIAPVQESKPLPKPTPATGIVGQGRTYKENAPHQSSEAMLESADATRHYSETSWELVPSVLRDGPQRRPEDS